MYESIHVVFKINLKSLILLMTDYTSNDKQAVKYHQMFVNVKVIELYVHKLKSTGNLNRTPKNSQFLLSANNKQFINGILNVITKYGHNENQLGSYIFI